MAAEHCEVDVLVVGSGAGGMTAAITARSAGAEVLLVEKGRRFGGSTALSGGGVWVPNNPALHRAGVVDDREEVLEYLTALTRGLVDADRLSAYVDCGPKAMALLEQSRWVRFRWVRGYSDYHPELPGGSQRGRTVEPLPIDTRELGADEHLQLGNTMRGPLGLWVTQKEYRNLALAKRTWAGRRASLVAAWRVSSNAVRRRHMASTGRALAVRLWLALRESGADVWLDSALTRLIVENGRVVGAAVSRDGQETIVHVRRGVILASGGFEQSQDLRDEHLPAAGRANESLGADTNTGDGIVAAADAGAALALMDEAWWMPSIRTPSGVVPLVSERSIPNHVIVDASGRRFTNESAPYVTFVHRQLAGRHQPAWFVMDSVGRSRYPFARVLPGQGFPAAWYEAGVVVAAPSLAELARAISVPADTLAETIDRFNGYSVSGHDPEFGRGDSRYDHYYGDPTMPTNPCLGPIRKAPYYAIKIVVGDLGTKGGILTDAHARVMNESGAFLPGLYATGNCAASVMGDEYAGPGATIGPAIVFGYIAALHATGASDRAPATE